MTIHDAKRDCQTRLTQFGIETFKITARTIGFSDLMRGDVIFVSLHQPRFPSGLSLRDLNHGIPKPSAGGYIIDIA